jgi:hypothetical protein
VAPDAEGYLSKARKFFFASADICLGWIVNEKT